MTAWEFICSFMPIASRERPGQMATRSEIKRWMQNKAVLFNAETMTWDEEIDFPIISLVLFPKSDGILGKTTLF